MNPKSTTYETLIGKIRDAKPLPEDPDALTESIMKVIQEKQQQKGLHIPAWVRPLMTSAAVFLLGLFIYQQLETTNNTQEAVTIQPAKIDLVVTSKCIPDETKNTTKNRRLLNQYICYLKSNMMANENSKSFYIKYLPKNQTALLQ